MKIKLKLPDKENKKSSVRGLGVSTNKSEINLWYYTSNSPKYICKAVSKDGLEFEKNISNFSLSDLTGKDIKKSDIKTLRFSSTNLLSFSEKNGVSFLAKSENGANWETFQQMPEGASPGIVIPEYTFEGKKVMYAGGEKILIGFLDNDVWKFTPLKLPDSDYSIDYVGKEENAIFLVYHTVSSRGPLEIKAVLFSLENPKEIIWSTPGTLWQKPEIWGDSEVYCLGYVNFHGKLISFWDVEKVGIFLITFPVFTTDEEIKKSNLKLFKHPDNPVVTPHPEHDWENEAVFNPAAFYDDGKVYLLYRAVGHDYISVIGYAESTDGIKFEKRLKIPAFIGTNNFDTKSPSFSIDHAKKYISGGGFGGCEDPRVTKIGDRLYMVYVAFNGYEPPRLAMTSILYENFLRHRFLWEKPVLISPPGVIDKSGCILPEKVNGKYVIFHRIYPNILIDFVDNLNFDGNTWLKGEFSISPRPGMWDSRKVGVGAPPIKTDDGWLLIYQAVGEDDPSKYKIGAMLLDLKDPTKVTHRSTHPIIEPTEHYENGLAKFGVVYPCGAVTFDNKLFVYYGGSDSVTCVATADLKEFLSELKNHESGNLNPIKL